MPADQLTTTIVQAVLSVLAGAPITEAAARADLDPAVLADAIELYHRAGTQALAQAEHAPAVHQIYLEFPEWPLAETIAAHHLLPELDHAERDGHLTGWWYIRKYPYWRLRLHIPTGAGSPRHLGAALDHLLAAGLLTRWWPGTYEPETAAFGGSNAIDIAHRLFHADSRAILDLAAHGTATLGRTETSVLLITTLLRAAGLEWYEQADVWDHVTSERPLPEDITPEHLTRMGEDLRHLLLADTSPVGPLFSPGSPLASTATWAAHFRQAGQALSAMAHTGNLERGLRRILSYHVIFHWNRFNIPPRTQAALTHAARHTILGIPPRQRTSPRETAPAANRDRTASGTASPCRPPDSP